MGECVLRLVYAHAEQAVPQTRALLILIDLGVVFAELLLTARRWPGPCVRVLNESAGLLPGAAGGDASVELGAPSRG